MNTRSLLQGCGIGISLTLSYIWGPLAADHIQGVYLRVLPVSTVAGGAALDLIAASLICWGALALFDRFDTSQKTLIWMLITAVVPATVIHSALQMAELGARIPMTSFLILAFLVPAFVVWKLRPAVYQKLVTVFRWGYLCAGVCILWVLPELAYAALHQEPRDAMETQRLATAGPVQRVSGQTRIVWLLLDELSYDQTFEHRQSGLSLANFDALQSQSISFTDVQPAGYYTDEILISLLGGRPVAAISSSLDGSLRAKSGDGTGWWSFDPQSTLFGDAERLGWSTGIVGWFNPYCRLFSGVVDRCMWEPESRMFPGHMSASNTSWQNALAPLDKKFRPNTDTRMGAEHGHAYGILMARGLQLLRDGNERFVFLHLPAPHPPGIYDRVSERIRDGGSYLDNLALADRTVGAVRAAIDASPEAENTILIVSGDHSMRVPTWRGTANWTPEDERVFGKRFDTRPVLLVHFPGQQSGTKVTSPFEEIQTHAMMEEMLAGRMNGDTALGSWLKSGALVAKK